MPSTESRDQVVAFDTTLRDGEQAPGINLDADAKVRIATQLVRLGADVIEAGFPAASPGDFRAVRAVATHVRGATIAALCRATPADVDRAAEALAPSPCPRLHTFIATSAVHMQHKLRMSPAQVREAVELSVARAKHHTFDVEFSAEDATRSDPAFLRDVYAAAIEAGATTCNVPDTVGYLLPTQFADLVSRLIDAVPGAAEVTWSVHCHDDLGLAVASSIAGIQAGARQVEVAVNGIGERAGNCAMEEVAMALRTHAGNLNVDVGLDSREIARTSELVSAATGYPVPRNKAIVGANAFAHESGIHQHGVLAERRTYEHLDAAALGYQSAVLVLGKHSGRHAFTAALRRLGYDLTPDQTNRAFERFKELADGRRTVTDADLHTLMGPRQQLEGVSPE